MKNRPFIIAIVVASIVALAAIGAWRRAEQSAQAARAQFTKGALEPMAVLLDSDQALIKALQADLAAEGDAAILPAYLAKIRHDGVGKNVQVKQHLDELAENNRAIVTLIKVYAPQARTAEFAAEADRFRNYASAWGDRWNSVMEIFMAGGNFPASGVPFPQTFPKTVKAEIASAR